MRSTSHLINGSLQLANSPGTLSAFLREIQEVELRDESLDTVELSIDTPWLDLTQLCALFHGIRTASAYSKKVNVHLPGVRDGKMRFLWQLGFWTHLQANSVQGNVFVQPDPWRFATKDDLTNSTAILLHDVSPDSSAPESCVYTFEKMLRSTAVFPAIEQSDAIVSNEYLFLLLWELLHNAQDHSAATQLSIISQVFLAAEAVDFLLQRHDTGESDRFFENLLSQHKEEYDHCSPELSFRKDWLARHGNASFLAISCVDDGIGIPQSLSTRWPAKYSSDVFALQDAFSGTTSSRRTDPRFFDVHGLAQILNLVADYDGYLFGQSGFARLEYTADKLFQVHAVKEEHWLPGTSFQILLPLVERPKLVTSAADRHGGTTPGAAGKHENSVSVVVHELLGPEGLSKIGDPARWPHLIAPLVSLANGLTTEVLYVDLVCMPPERQFMSFVLRSLRKLRNRQSVVVINASRELMAIVKSIAFGAPQELTHISDTEVFLCELDRHIATALTRGKEGHLLPLLLPFTSVNPSSTQTEIQWAGLSGLPRPWRAPISAALKHLLDAATEVPWGHLALSLTPVLVESGITPNQFLRGLKCVRRCNPSLLTITPTGLKLNLDQRVLHEKSYLSLSEHYNAVILPRFRHQKPSSKQHYLYSFGWRTGPLTRRFQKYYLSTWNELTNTAHLHVCVDLLLRLGFISFGEALLSIDSIVSVTPSAGLIARQLADRLGKPLHEVPSIYDLRGSEWMHGQPGQRVLIIHDVIGSGALTKRVLAMLKRRGMGCLGVLALVKGLGATRDLNADLKVLSLSEADLGIPTETECERAAKSGHYFEIDAYSLEPVPASTHTGVEKEEFEKKLAILDQARALFVGHFKYHRHHYEIYFSLSHLLSSEYKTEIIEWLRTNIVQFAKRARTSKVALVYPYHSPIYRLLDELRRQKFSITEPKIALEFVIARPHELTGNRLAYSVVPRGTNQRALECAVFLDDGIASGETFSSQVIDLLEKQSRAILALVFFDRIEAQSRRHLAYVGSYEIPERVAGTRLIRKRHAMFQFNAFVRGDLPTFSATNCPWCELLSLLPEKSVYRGILYELLDKLRALLSATPVNDKALDQACWLSGTDAVDFITFNNFFYSGVPSEKEIYDRLRSKRRSPKTRLSLLITVMCDRKLHHVVHTRRDLDLFLKGTFFAEGVSSSDRARFILRSYHWANHDAATWFLTEGLPNLYGMAYKEAAGEHSTLEEYFDKNPLEAASIFGALIRITSRWTPSEERAPIKEAVATMTNWQGAFQDVNGHHSGSAYLFEIRALLAKDPLPEVDQARLLMTNFVGSYRYHSESFQQRCITFRHCFITARQVVPTVFPKPLFEALLQSINATQSLFRSAAFSDKAIGELRTAFHDYEDGKPANLAQQLEDHFDSPDPLIHPDTVHALLLEAAPNVATVVQNALKMHTSTNNETNCKSDLNDATDTNELRLCRVYGNKGDLIQILAHLLDNPIKHKDSESGSVRLTLRAETPSSDDGLGFVLIHVEDNNVGVPESTLRASFGALGGLTAQQPLVKRWGGDILYSKGTTGVNVFTLKLLIAFKSETANDPDNAYEEG